MIINIASLVVVITIILSAQGIVAIVELPPSEENNTIKSVLPILVLLLVALAIALTRILLAGVKKFFWRILIIGLLAGTIIYAWHAWPTTVLGWGIVISLVCMLLLFMRQFGILKAETGCDRSVKCEMQGQPCCSKHFGRLSTPPGFVLSNLAQCQAS